MPETWIQSLGWEDLLEKGKATHSSTLAWKIPWTEEPGRLQSMVAKSRTRLSDFTSLHFRRVLEAIDTAPTVPNGNLTMSEEFGKQNIKEYESISRHFKCFDLE